MTIIQIICSVLLGLCSGNIMGHGFVNKNRPILITGIIILLCAVVMIIVS